MHTVAVIVNLCQSYLRDLNLQETLDTYLTILHLKMH